MKKKFLFGYLVAGFILTSDVFCMTPLEKIQSATEKDLSATRVMSPVDAISEAQKMSTLLQAVEDSDSGDEEILDYIAPVCAQYREKADVVAFDEFAGVDHEQLLAYQIAISNYYKVCADLMSNLIKSLLLRRVQSDD